MRLSTSYLPVIGIVLFAYIVKNVGVGKILNQLQSLRPFYIIPIFFVIVINILIKGVKWKTVIRAYGFDYPTWNACVVFLIGIFVGLITPGRIGDLVRAFYLKNDKISLGKSLSTVVVDRLMDVSTLFILALFSTVWLGLVLGVNSIYLPIALSAFVFSLVASVVIHKENAKKILKPVFRILVPDKYKSSVRLDFEDFYSGMYNARKPMLALAFSLGAASWFVAALEAYLIALALNLNIPYHYFVFFVPIIILIELIPITISGLGTREATAIFLFSLIGFTAEKAVAFSILSFILGYLLIAIVGGALWFRNPIRMEI